MTGTEYDENTIQYIHISFYEYMRCIEEKEKEKWTEKRLTERKKPLRQD